MCAHTHKESKSASVLHTRAHGLSLVNTHTAAVSFLNVMILNRCKQRQEA